MSEHTKKKCLGVITDTLGFVIPYIQREMPEWEVIGLSDANIDKTEGCDAIVVLRDYEESAELPVPPGATLLVCSNVIGTGMNGLGMLLARGIASGRYFHIEGIEAKISTIHASDVAKAVELSLGDGGKYFITDGTDTGVAQLAEALAVRLNDKRILTLKPWMAKILMPARLRRIVTVNHTSDGTDFINKFGFEPTPVVEYLRHHVYDESSL